MTLSLVFTLAAVTVLVIAALSPAMATAQTSSMIDMDTAMSFMDRLNGIMEVCAEQVQSNVALFTPCMNIINNFNNHMTQLFEEEQNDMTQILLAGNQ